MTTLEERLKGLTRSEIIERGLEILGRMAEDKETPADLEFLGLSPDGISQRQDYRNVVMFPGAAETIISTLTQKFLALRR